MPTLYIANAFSLSMLDAEAQTAGPAGKIIDGVMRMARVPRPIKTPSTFIAAAECGGHEIVSVLGHESTRPLFEKILNRPCPVNRVNLKLNDDMDKVLVGQYIGPRLPDGATVLPDGARIEWWLV